METLIKDIKYGLRGLFKRKGFAAIAVLTLALGIGANTAIFTLVNAVMLKTLPVQKPEELVLFSDMTGEGTSFEDSPRVGEWKRFSYASYVYFRDHAPPHFHAQYAGEEAVIAIADGRVIRGEIPDRALRLVREWLERIARN